MHRVLLAEDNKLNQIAAAGTLHKLGCNVTITDDGADVVEACRHNTFDAVLMDVMTPDMDGYEATTAIRSLTTLRGGP